MWPYPGNNQNLFPFNHSLPTSGQQVNLPPCAFPTQALLAPLQNRPAFPLAQFPPLPHQLLSYPVVNAVPDAFLSASEPPMELNVSRFPNAVLSPAPPPGFCLPQCPPPRTDTFYYFLPQPQPVQNVSTGPYDFRQVLPSNSWISHSRLNFTPRNPPFDLPPPPPPPPPKPRLINVNNIINSAVSQTRPQRIVIVLRGLPGSGKSFAARAVKEKEFSVSGRNPRILSIDDYFLVEPDNGESSAELRYEFNAELEKSYRTSLLKSFKKTVDDNLFPFIIVDSCNDKISYFDEYVAHALSRGFAVYVGTVNTDIEQCKLRSHGRREAEDVELMAKFWEQTPDNFLQVDLSPLICPDINTVEMEDVGRPGEDKEGISSRKRKCDDDLLEKTQEAAGEKKSKWELMDITEEQIDRLDGLRLKRSKSSKESESASSNKEGTLFTDSGVTIFDNIKNEEIIVKSSKKHISWADVEQYKRSLKERHNQFDRLLSEINARSSLVKVHLI